MQFVILKDEYELDQYGVEIKNKIATECNEYLQTGECSLTIRPADSPDVVHVDENEVPDDVKTVLKTAYEAREKYLSPVSRTTKEGAARLRADYDNAMKALDEFSHKDEISLLDFVKEFFKHVPDEIKKEIIDNEYKVIPEKSALFEKIFLSPMLLKISLNSAVVSKFSFGILQYTSSYSGSDFNKSLMSRLSSEKSSSFFGRMPINSSPLA